MCFFLKPLAGWLQVTKTTKNLVNRASAGTLLFLHLITNEAQRQIIVTIIINFTCVNYLLQIRTPLAEAESP